MVIVCMQSRTALHKKVSFRNKGENWPKLISRCYLAKLFALRTETLQRPTFICFHSFLFFFFLKNFINKFHPKVFG